MLKKLILENWKSFRYAELPLDPLTVLIGTNASGKSNVVEALEFLQRIANGENIETALAGNKTLSSIRGGVELAARKGENEFTLKILFSCEDDETDYLYVIKTQTLPECKFLEEYIESHTYTQDTTSNKLTKFTVKQRQSNAKSGIKKIGRDFDFSDIINNIYHEIGENGSLIIGKELEDNFFHAKKKSQEFIIARGRGRPKMQEALLHVEIIQNHF